MVLRNNVPEPRGNSLQLVLILHAWSLSSANLCDVRATVAETMPDADLLVPDYPSGRFSSADPIEITEALLADIDKAVEARANRGGGYRDRKSVV